MLDKMATKRQLGGNLKANLRPKRAWGHPRTRNARSRLSSAKCLLQKEASGTLTPRAGLTAAAGFSPQRGSPGGGLSATYCPPNEKPCVYEFPAAYGVHRKICFSFGFRRLLAIALLVNKIAEGRPRYPKIAPRWHQDGSKMRPEGLLGASWGRLWASWGPLGSLLGASWRHLGASAGVILTKVKIS